MLKRIITGLLLAPIFLWSLYAMPSIAVSGLMGLIFTAALWEASSLVGFSSPVKRYAYVLCVGLGGFAVSAMLAHDRYLDWMVLVCGIAVVWWLAAPFLLWKFSTETPGIYGTPVSRGVVTAFVLITAWVAVEMLYLKDSGRPTLLVSMIFMIWVADSAAYFSGKLFGKHKLAPTVSPGKTIEGVIGGLIGSAIFATAFAIYVLHLDARSVIVWAMFSALVVLLSVAGDLNESALKRVAHKKDSSTIIPGHGGFFDRIDAITAAAPVFLIGWLVFREAGMV